MKTKALLIGLACMLTFGLVGCGNNNQGSSTGGNQPSAVEYRVTFETNGGSSVSPKTGTIYSSPTTTRSGYTFLGWYSDYSLSRKVSFPFTPTSDTTLYAKWEKVLTDKDKLIQYGKVTCNPSSSYGSCSVTLEYLSSNDKFRMTVINDCGYPLSFDDKLVYDFTFGSFGFGSGTYQYNDNSTYTHGSFSTSFTVTYTNYTYTFSFNGGLTSEQRGLVTSNFQLGYTELDNKVSLLLGFKISNIGVLN